MGRKATGDKVFYMLEMMAIELCEDWDSTLFEDMLAIAYIFDIDIKCDGKNIYIEDEVFRLS